MKRMFLLICLCLLTALSAFAFEKGTKGIGGTVFFDGYKEADYRPTLYNFSLAPRVSYFLFKNFSIDVEIFFNTSWGKEYSTRTGLGFGLGGRYFFKKFYGGIFFNYTGTRKKENYYYEGQYEQSYYWRMVKELTFKAGRMFGIARNIYIDLGVYYNIGLGKMTSSIEGLVDYENNRKRFGTLAGIAIFF